MSLALADPEIRDFFEQDYEVAGLWHGSGNRLVGPVAQIVRGPVLDSLRMRNRLLWVILPRHPLPSRTSGNEGKAVLPGSDVRS